MLNLASLQKLHELDERARGVPGALFDHLDLADGYTGKRGKACSRVTTSLADGAESFWRHLGRPRCVKAMQPRLAHDVGSINMRQSSQRVWARFNLFTQKTGDHSFMCGGFQKTFFVKVDHSNSPKSKGAEAPEGLAATALAFMQSVIERGKIMAIFDEVHDMPVKFFVGKFAKVHGLPSHISGRISLHVAKGNKVITGADCFGRSRFAVQDNCAGFFNFLFDGHLSISVPDDTLLAHNVQPRKHKVRANDDLLREPDHD